MYKFIKLWWFFNGSKILRPLKPLFDYSNYIRDLIDEKYLLYRYQSDIDEITYFNIYFKDGSWYLRWRRHYEMGCDTFDFIDMAMNNLRFHNLKKKNITHELD